MKANAATSKQSYYAAKEELAQQRKLQRQRQKNEQRAKQLEALLDDLQKQLFGDAATDYVLAASIQSQIDEAEEELMSVYEALEE